MDSHGRRNHAKCFREECDCNSTFSIAKHIPSPRTPSLSSLRPPCCSDETWADYDPPFRFFGVPFSWEYLPGIPKEHTPDQVDHSLVNLLPLPPSIASPSSRKLKFEEKKRDNSGEKKLREDPFFAALIECSKGNDGLLNSEIWSNPQVVSRSISDRFRFIHLYCSCERTAQVSDSIVYLPKSTGNLFQQIAANQRLCKYK